jgi:hypothetical protein
MKRFSSVVLTSLVALSLLVLPGCDSNEDDGISDEAVEDVAAMMQDIYSVLGLAGIGAPGHTNVSKIAESQPQPTIQAAETFACPEGGELTYDISERTSENSSTWTAMFDECNGLTGELAYTVGFAIREAGFNVTFVMDGSVQGPSCTLDFDRYTATTSSIGEAGSVVLNGSFSSQCGSERFTCLYDSVALQEDVDADAMRTYCSWE